jgi:hypothetical protein
MVFLRTGQVIEIVNALLNRSQRTNYLLHYLINDIIITLEEFESFII